MEDTLISSQVAKLAKEKGFDIKTKLFYTNNLGLCHTFGDGEWLWSDKNRGLHYDSNCEFDDLTGERFYAPNQSLLQKWLRDECNILINVDSAIENDWYYQLKYSPNEKTKVYKCSDLLGDFKTYEEALEEGLQEALKLIKDK